MKFVRNWTEYECLDIGNKMKIERFGSYLFLRPEPTVNGDLTLRNLDFNGKYTNNTWETHDLPETWTLSYRDMKFNLRPHEFKHLGVFPEQAVNWDFIRDAMKRYKKPMRILNLFGYTGAATIAAAMENPEEVVHVDALKSAINRTKENIALNDLEHIKIRTIVDDVMKFIAREEKRGRTYHGIIMDPPSFGRGPNKEIWKIEEMLKPLLDACVQILDKDAVFMILNTYTTNLDLKSVETTMKQAMRSIPRGAIKGHDLIVPVSTNNRRLYCGKTTRWCIYEDLL